jgi:hypothetical protein
MMNETSEDIFDLVTSNPVSVSPDIAPDAVSPDIAQDNDEMTSDEILILATLESETSANNQANIGTIRPSLLNITNTLNLNQMRVPMQTPTVCQPTNRLQRFPLTASLATASNQASSALQSTASNQATSSLQASTQSTSSLNKTASKRTLLADQSDEDDEHENQPPAKKRGGGRPKGSKNKKTIAREVAASANI